MNENVVIVAVTPFTDVYDRLNLMCASRVWWETRDVLLRLPSTWYEVMRGCPHTADIVRIFFKGGRLQDALNSIHVFEDFDDILLSAVLRLTPNLERLSIEEGHLLENGSLDAAAESCRLLTLFDVSNCQGFADASFVMFAVGCRHLAHVGLAGCSELTDMSVEALSSNCASLIHLDISGCHRVVGTSFGLLSNGCRSLVTIDIRECTVSDAAVDALVNGHASPINIAIGCPTLGDISLDHIAIGCPLLDKLKLEGCSGITGNGITRLAARCSSLTILLFDNDDISSECVKSVTINCPLLQAISRRNARGRRTKMGLIYKDEIERIKTSQRRPPYR
jgi:hypothetical protein